MHRECQSRPSDSAHVLQINIKQIRALPNSPHRHVSELTTGRTGHDRSQQLERIGCTVQPAALDLTDPLGEGDGPATGAKRLLIDLLAIERDQESLAVADLEQSVRVRHVAAEVRLGEE